MILSVWHHIAYTVLKLILCWSAVNKLLTHLGKLARWTGLKSYGREILYEFSSILLYRDKVLGWLGEKIKVSKIWMHTVDVWHHIEAYYFLSVDSFNYLFVEQVYDSLFLLFSKHSCLQLISSNLCNSPFLVSCILTLDVDHSQKSQNTDVIMNYQSAVTCKQFSIRTHFSVDCGWVKNFDIWWCSAVISNLYFNHDCCAMFFSPGRPNVS